MKLHTFTNQFDFTEISDLAMAGDIVILKSVIAPDECNLLRNQLLRWRQIEEPLNHMECYYSRNKLNYHIRVENHKAKKHERDWIDYEEGVTKINVHNFRIGDYKDSDFSKKVPAFSEVGKKLLNIYSKVSPNKAIEHGRSSGKNLFFEVAHYNDGGYIDVHTHVRHIEFGQDLNMLTMLSKPNRDFTDGQLYFQSKEEMLNVAKEFSVGDVLFFRMDLPHGVTSVSLPEAGSGHDGRWTMSTFYY